MVKAELARFYGWTDDYIGQLDYDIAMEYIEAMEVIKARELMISYDAAIIPNLKETAQSSRFNKARKRANPIHLQEETSFEDFAKSLGMG